jgi:hypothetical protein
MLLIFELHSFHQQFQNLQWARINIMLQGHNSRSFGNSCMDRKSVDTYQRIAPFILFIRIWIAENFRMMIRWSCMIVRPCKKTTSNLFTFFC